MPIGLKDLIERRHQEVVPRSPGGRLSDYIPFYFTPLSMMAYRIRTGRNVRQRANEEIVILVSSIKRFEGKGVKFLFTDQHASVAGARFYASSDDLHRVDWSILQNRDFVRDNEDLGKTDRYQAEALVHKHLPLEDLLGVACFDNNSKQRVERLAEHAQVSMKVIRRARWYFQ